GEGAGGVRGGRRAEWRQMFAEICRIERDSLHAPGFHGLDLKEAARRYRPYLRGLASRHDLNYLFAEMLGELSLGHVRVGGGAVEEGRPVGGGLLGADYRVEGGRDRVARG